MATTKEAVATVSAEKYSVEEFAAHAMNVFGVMPEVAKTALMMAGVTETTESNAKKIVEKFMKQEVK